MAHMDESTQNSTQLPGFKPSVLICRERIKYNTPNLIWILICRTSSKLGDLDIDCISDDIKDLLLMLLSVIKEIQFCYRGSISLKSVREVGR